MNEYLGSLLHSDWNCGKKICNEIEIESNTFIKYAEILNAEMQKLKPITTHTLCRILC